jgi:hypothetical protein
MTALNRDLRYTEVRLYDVLLRKILLEISQKNSSNPLNICNFQSRTNIFAPVRMPNSLPPVNPDCNCQLLFGSQQRAAKSPVFDYQSNYSVFAGFVGGLLAGSTVQSSQIFVDFDRLYIFALFGYWSACKFLRVLWTAITGCGRKNGTRTERKFRLVSHKRNKFQIVISFLAVVQSGVPVFAIIWLPSCISHMCVTFALYRLPYPFRCFLASVDCSLFLLVLTLFSTSNVSSSAPIIR